MEKSKDRYVKAGVTFQKTGMRSIPEHRKTVAPLYFADTYGFAIRGYRIKRGVAF